MTHICEKCSRVFKQKSHLDEHAAKKKDCRPPSPPPSPTPSPISAEHLNDELEMQRERLSTEYRHATRRAARNGRQLSYDNQQEAAAQIIEHFRNGKSAVVLVAQPGAGKTGVALEVMYRLGIGIPASDALSTILTDQMVICSGMNDREWRGQFSRNMLPSLGKHVYHRGSLPANRKVLATAKLVVDDECHIAAEKDMIVSKVFKEAGLLDIEEVEATGRKILQISATPEAVTHDLKRWGERAAVVKLQPSEKYKGFRTMLNEGRIKLAPELDSYESVLKLLSTFNERYVGTTKKFFPMRVRDDMVIQWIEKASAELGWGSPLQHNSSSRIEDIDEQMSHAPTQHIVILIKGFWRASKRLVRDHVGGSYEAIPAGKRNTTATAQGLTARFCDTFEYAGDYLNPNERPLHYCDVEAIKEYVEWFEEGDCDYKKAAYTAPRLTANGKGRVRASKTKLHHTNVEGLQPTHEAVDKRKTVPFVFVVTQEEMSALYSSKTRQQHLMELLKKYNSALQQQLSTYGCIQITCPRAGPSIQRSITSVVTAAQTGKAIKTGIRGKENQNKNCYSCHLDKENNRICLIIWNGATDTNANANANTIQHV